MTNELSIDQMLNELTITFPALRKRRLSELGKEFAGQSGIWTGADSRHLMQDGEPIFQPLAIDGEPPYINGAVHQAFEAWLHARGWTWARYDGDTFLLRPNSSCDQLDAWFDEHRATIAHSAVDKSDPCPF